MLGRSLPFRPRRSGGQSLTEFALAVPVFLLVLLTIVEAAAFAYTYTNLQRAVQEGGRVAALPGTSEMTQVRDRVVERARPVDVDPADVAITVNGIECLIETCFTARVSGDRVLVTLSFSYQPVGSAVFGAGATFNLPDLSAEFMVE
ncbi:MAG TPA: TadE family protein [Candidatus Limnocylindria bacterium]|nr:TadE family protein [Candidatus Limnocylindria bacterium]